MQIIARIAAEINLKSPKVRQFFMERLEHNIHDVFKNHGIQAKVKRAWGRIFIETDSPRALSALQKVFGLHSVSPVDRRVEADMELIVAAAVELYADKLAGKSFAVRTKRAGVPGFTSIEVDRVVGSALFPYASSVNLKNPDIQINIDLRSEGVFFFSEVFEGPKGLPLGVEGRAICLISGGFDSPVAAWYLLKRGVALDFVFCNMAGESYERSVLAITKNLVETWCHGYEPKMFIVPFGDLVADIKENCKSNYGQVVLKRDMYRVANKLAKKTGGQALITGECIGQVSSQTLHNIRAIETASELPLLRPVIAFEKEEIIAKSKMVGNFTLSQHVKEYCNITPNKPVTKATPEKVDEVEMNRNLNLIDVAVEAATMLRLKDVDAEDLLTDYLFTRKIEKDSQVIDCREAVDYQLWHAPDSVHMDADQLMVDFKSLDKEKSYVLYCEFGLQSAVAAEAMQKLGYEAYSFAGGVRHLRPYLESH